MIPICESLVLIRTDFSDDSLWQAFLSDATSPPEPFEAFFKIVDDRTFAGKSVDEVLALLPHDYIQPAIFIADERAIREDGHPCLVVGPLGEDLRPFRSLAREIASIDSNLSIANMGYEEFADATDSTGVFRGFE